jgi:hypothetical protein
MVAAVVTAAAVTGKFSPIPITAFCDTEKKSCALRI